MKSFLVHMLFWMLLSGSAALHAQNLVNETSLYVPAGLTVTLPASMVNNNLLQNNGTIALEGDWLNVAIYQGTGLIQLQGTDQLISNNNQPAAQVGFDGGGQKKIKGTLVVNDRLIFTDGIVLTGAADSLFASPNIQVTGGSTSSYVEGPLISQGSGYRFYPVGKNGKYHPVELTDIKGASPVIAVEVLEDLPTITTDINSTVRPDIYWSRKTIHGTFTGSPITLGYDFANAEADRIVVLEGNDLSTQFSVIENNLIQSSAGLMTIETRNDITGNYFALGELIGPLPKASYFSTTLSPTATLPENRVVRIFGDNISDDNFYFQVFDRWGIVLFETKSLSDMSLVGWDGKQSGNMLPSGAYPYSLKYNAAGKAHHQSGYITILR